MEEQKLESKKKKKVIIIIVAVVLAVLALIFAIVLIANSKPTKVNRHMKAAEKYMTELDYKSAVAEYEAVIEIDPKNVEAYLGLADAYVGLGDIDYAVIVLEKGYENSGDSDIKDRLDNYINDREKQQEDNTDDEEDSDGVAEIDEELIELPEGAPDIDYDELIDTLLSCGDFGEYRWDGKSDFSYLQDVYGLTDGRRINYEKDVNGDFYQGEKYSVGYQYLVEEDDNGIYSVFSYLENYVVKKESNSLHGHAANYLLWATKRGEIDNEIYASYMSSLSQNDERLGLFKFLEKYDISSIKEYSELIGIVDDGSIYIYDIPTSKYGSIDFSLQRSGKELSSLYIYFNDDDIYSQISICDAWNEMIPNGDGSPRYELYMVIRFK